MHSQAEPGNEKKVLKHRVREDTHLHEDLRFPNVRHWSRIVNRSFHGNHSLRRGRPILRPGRAAQ